MNSPDKSTHPSANPPSPPDARDASPETFYEAAESEVSNAKSERSGDTDMVMEILDRPYWTSSSVDGTDDSPDRTPHGRRSPVNEAVKQQASHPVREPTKTLESRPAEQRANQPVNLQQLREQCVAQVSA